MYYLSSSSKFTYLQQLWVNLRKYLLTPETTGVESKLRELPL